MIETGSVKMSDTLSEKSSIEVDDPHHLLLGDDEQRRRSD